MTPSAALDRIRKYLKYESDGPHILKPEFLGETYAEFCKTPVAKTIAKNFSKSANADTSVAIAYASFVENRSSKAFKRPLEVNIITRIQLESFKQAFPTLMGTELTRKQFGMYSQGTRLIKVDLNYDKSLNLSLFPKAVAVQLLMAKRSTIDAVLTKQIGYAFKEVPQELRKGTAQISSLLNLPIYQWVFYASINGVNVSMKRVNKDLLAMRFEFALPFVLPLGSMSPVTMTNKIGDFIQHLSLGVK